MKVVDNHYEKVYPYPINRYNQRSKTHYALIESQGCWKPDRNADKTNGLWKGEGNAFYKQVSKTYASVTWLEM